MGTSERDRRMCRTIQNARGFPVDSCVPCLKFRTSDSILDHHVVGRIYGGQVGGCRCRSIVPFAAPRGCVARNTSHRIAVRTLYGIAHKRASLHFFPLHVRNGRQFAA